MIEESVSQLPIATLAIHPTPYVGGRFSAGRAWPKQVWTLASVTPRDGGAEVVTTRGTETARTFYPAGRLVWVEVAR